MKAKDAALHAVSCKHSIVSMTTLSHPALLTVISNPSQLKSLPQSIPPIVNTFFGVILASHTVTDVNVMSIFNPLHAPNPVQSKAKSIIGSVMEMVAPSHDFGPMQLNSAILDAVIFDPLQLSVP